MKKLWVALLLIGGTVKAADRIVVEVYLDRDNWPRPVGRSVNLVSTFFEAADVDVKWHLGKKPQTIADNTLAVAVRLAAKAPAEASPLALASAKPFAPPPGEITLYVDRVEAFLEQIRVDAEFLLGYILAHELGHVLQGTDYHAPGGIMKAHWTQRERMEMISLQLKFTERDVAAIRRGPYAQAGAINSTRFPEGHR